MARAIVRYSLAANAKKARAEIRARLESAGFKSIGTASWEGVDRELVVLAEAIRDVLVIAERSRALDHLWVYLDDPG